MSSNLYKQYNVREKQEGVRIIDSNEMVQEKLEELTSKLQMAAEADGQQFTEGFTVGLTAQSVEQVLKSPKEIEEEAQEAAAKLLADAKQEADTIVANAKKEADAIQNKARENGYQEGYQNGEQEGRAEAERSYRQKEEALEHQKVQQQEAYDRQLQELEPVLLDVVIQVVEKVFHIQFDDKADILLYLIQNAILNIENSRSFHVRVGDEERLFLEKHKEEILDRVGHDISLDILSDPLLKGNQCVIETESGVFDCSLGVQLENLIKDLRSLSS